ncbi:MAG: hypothetical protein QW842_04870 [Candidatus Nezhaarchaeales archaeon]
MCNLELSEVLDSANYLKGLGLVRLVNDQIQVTDACLKLMLGKLSKSKRRAWILVKCREGYEGLLKGMGFIGRGTMLFAPLMRLMINEVDGWCDVIIACYSKLLSELWVSRVGGLTPWSSLSSAVEARNRALSYLKFKERNFVHAVKATVKKLVEAFTIAKDFSVNLDLRSGLEALSKELRVNLSSLLEDEVVERDPLKAISILDEGIDACKSFLERSLVIKMSHPRFKELEGFEFCLGV